MHLVAGEKMHWPSGHRKRLDPVFGGPKVDLNMGGFIDQTFEIL